MLIFAIILSLATPWSVRSFRASLGVAPSNRGVISLRRQQQQNLHIPRTALYATSSSQSSTELENTWRSAIRTPSSTAAVANPISCVKELCTSTPCGIPDTTKGESGLAFLFVSQTYLTQSYEESFQDIVSAAYETLGEDVTLLSVVGGGVVGGGVESDDPNAPAMSLLCGILPATASLEVFMFGPDEAPPPSSSKAWNAIGRSQDTPSYILFADPFSKIQEIVNGLDCSGNSGEEGSAVVAGGISCPAIFGEDAGSTVALNGKAYPRGSAVGVGLSGTVGLQAVVAQGCRPVGSAYHVTEADGNMIESLDGRPAVEVLADIKLTEEEKQTVEKFGIMCGLATPGAKDVMEGDYLIRQIMGFRVPAIMVGSEVKVDQVLKFHVRDPEAAMEDLRNMINRAKTERMFRAGGDTGGGGNTGRPLAALQVSCVARGRSLFGSPNVDVTNIQGLLGGQDGSNAAIGGFFANGEIGPVGIAGVGLASKATHMHAFTAVACAICNFSAPSSMPSSSLDEMMGTGTNVENEDDSAWG